MQLRRRRGYLTCIPEETPLESFEKTEIGIKAYWPLDAVSKEEITEQLLDLPLNLSFTFGENIPWKNWNEEWEKNYTPIFVNENLCVRAPFHQKSNAKAEIIIQAKMSFGTGHHSTTRLMLNELSKMELTGRKVLDFGSGTGILGIFCGMNKCSDLVMIDHEPWTIENMEENISLNQIFCKVELICGELKEVQQNNFDLILANINKSVLLEYSHSLSKKLSQNGIIIVSGILLEDEQEIVDSYIAHGLSKINSASENEWLLISFTKNS